MLLIPASPAAPEKERFASIFFSRSGAVGGNFWHLARCREAVSRTTSYRRLTRECNNIHSSTGLQTLVEPMRLDNWSQPTDSTARALLFLQRALRSATIITIFEVASTFNNGVVFLFPLVSSSRPRECDETNDMHRYHKYQKGQSRARPRPPSVYHTLPLYTVVSLLGTYGLGRFCLPASGGRSVHGSAMSLDQSEPGAVHTPHMP